MIGHKVSAILKGQYDKGMRIKKLYIPVLTTETEILVINKNQW